MLDQDRTILFPYAGETQGGSVHSSYLLIEELLRRNQRVLLGFHGDGYARDLARKRGFPLIDLPALGNQSEMARPDGLRLGNFLAAFACRKTIGEHGIGLVHVNDKRMLRTWCLPARSQGVRLVVHWRSVYRPSWSVDVGFRLTSRIICVSQYSQDKLPDSAKRKSRVVYNPFEPTLDAGERAHVRGQIRKAAGIPAEAAVIGYFGTLHFRKRPHVLLKLLQRIEKTADGRPVYGIVCGDTVEPIDEQFFELLKSTDWHGRVVMPGFVSNVIEWMASCDVLVAPAIDEPLARVGVEAQSVGLPAIVSSDGGLREVVEHGISGLIVDPYDFEAWVTSVRRVLDDPDVAQQLANGGIEAAAKLTIGRHADQICEIYENLLAA